MDIVYVLTHETTGKVGMATTNDAEAWALYRDMKCHHISVFLNKNEVARVNSLNSKG